MRVSRWRHGILALAVFLALPAFVFAEGDATCTESKTQSCLQWFSVEDGLRVTKPFEYPTDCTTDIECFVGETKLEDCNTLNPLTEVTFNEELKNYSLTPSLEEIVYCFESKKKEQRTYRALKESDVCVIGNAKSIEYRWESVFTPYAEGVKANPWDGTKSYCPDPIDHSVAYDIDEWKAGMPTKDLIRRQLLEACSQVVLKRKEVCEQKKGTIAGEIGGEATKRDAGIEKEKRLEIVKWIDWSECTVSIGETGDIPLKGNCLERWNLIKNYTAKQLEVSPGADGKFLKNPSTLDNYFTLKKKIEENMRENALQDDDKKWTTGTLEEFITGQVEGTYDDTESNTAITTKNKETQKVAEAISFLQKRLNNLRISNSLSETKTFNVTNLLRRNRNSTESELSLFEKDGALDSNGTPKNVFDKVIRLVTQVLGSLGVLLLIISALMMIVSQGEETMLQKAKQTFLYTVIGLVIAFFSYTIVRFILELLLLR